MKKEETMNEKQNLHTHSLFCDGKNSLEEMVMEAINQGFTSIGSMLIRHSPSMSAESKAKKKRRNTSTPSLYLKKSIGE